jgi:hypothetical protein
LMATSVTMVRIIQSDELSDGLTAIKGVNKTILILPSQRFSSIIIIINPFFPN